MTARGPLNFLVIPKQHNPLSIHLCSIRTSPALRVAGVAGASQVSLVRKLGLAVEKWAVYCRTNKHSHSHSHLQAIYSLQIASSASLLNCGRREPRENPQGEDAKHHTERPRGSNPHTSWFVITVLTTAQAVSPRNKVTNNQIQG